MNETLLFGTAIFVFVMMIIGLGLTMLEFARGEPHRQKVEFEKKRSNSPSSVTRPRKAA